MKVKNYINDLKLQGFNDEQIQNSLQSKSLDKTDMIKDQDVLKKYIRSLSKEEREQHILDYLEDAIEWDIEKVIDIVEDQLKKPLEKVYQETIEKDKERV